MVFGIGGKKRSTEEYQESTPPTLGPPTDLVLSMRQQGYTNNQIVESLQRDGYSSDQIFDAMSQADIKGGVQGMSFPGQADFSTPMAYPQAPEPPLPPSEGFGKERVEELTEAIIEEKWSDLTKHITRIIEWKNKTESKIEVIEAKIDQLQKSFDELNNAIVGRIGDYDKHITNLGSDLKAMEMVFQKVLPSFTQNVNELSRIVKGSKLKKKKS